jgi:hypothetical protein
MLYPCAELFPPQFYIAIHCSGYIGAPASRLKGPDGKSFEYQNLCSSYLSRRLNRLRTLDGSAFARGLDSRLNSRIRRITRASI